MMNKSADKPEFGRWAAAELSAAFAIVLAFGGLTSAKAEQVFCPEASPYHVVHLGQVTWTHEYSTDFLRRVQIGPGAHGTRILCEKLHGIVSTEIEGTCTFLPGNGRVETEAEYGIKICSMPPHANRRTNVEDCRIVCGTRDKMVSQLSAPAGAR
jgi:hypothetical protein